MQPRASSHTLHRSLQGKALYLSISLPLSQPHSCALSAYSLENFPTPATIELLPPWKIVMADHLRRKKSYRKKKSSLKSLPQWKSAFHGSQNGCKLTLNSFPRLKNPSSQSKTASFGNSWHSWTSRGRDVHTGTHTHTHGRTRARCLRKIRPTCPAMKIRL